MFITLEGIDGSGKSTAAQIIAERLRERFGIRPYLTSELNHTAFGLEIKKLINKGVDARTELQLIVAARSHHMESVLIPQLDAGVWVICDRFINSTLAYQGHGRKLGVKAVLDAHINMPNMPVPDLTIFIQVTPATARLRLKSRGVSEPMDNQDPEFYERVNDGFFNDPFGPEIPDYSLTITNEDIPIEQFEAAVAASLDIFLQSKGVKKACNDAA